MQPRRIPRPHRSDGAALEVTETRGTPGETGPGPLVLVGLSGAGKSESGRKLAADLGWDFLDLDEEIERRAGLPIGRIFSERGEGAFRELEAEITASASPSRATVVSTGGGWMERPELRDSWPGAVRIWLRVNPRTALDRLAKQPATRPLLAGPDPLARLEDMLGRRSPSYALAEYSVQTDGLSPAEVANVIRTALGI